MNRRDKKLVLLVVFITFALVFSIYTLAKVLLGYMY